MIAGDKISFYAFTAGVNTNDFLDVVISTLLVAFVLVTGAHLLSLIDVAGMEDRINAKAGADIVKPVQVCQLRVFAVDLGVTHQAETDHSSSVPVHHMVVGCQIFQRYVFLRFCRCYGLCRYSGDLQIRIFLQEMPDSIPCMLCSRCTHLILERSGDGRLRLPCSVQKQSFSLPLGH